MKVRFQVIPYCLNFKFAAGTSRGVLTKKETWFIKVWEVSKPSAYGLGEAGPLQGLSEDYSGSFEHILKQVCHSLESMEVPDSADAVLQFVKEQIAPGLPSVRFGLETALLDLVHGGKRIIFNNAFHQGACQIPINGLVWMGEEDFMRRQIDEKLKAGFDCIKMKIGAIDFEQEVRLLESIRAKYGEHEVTIRVDANGAFDANTARDRLQVLVGLGIHSIEQPVKPGNRELMRRLCDEGLLPVALDEALIGVHEVGKKEELLKAIRPQYIVLKPSLVGGMLSCQEWIALAESMNIGWWMTSMLESNIGLNAIAQLTAEHQVKLPQGLGTGQLYENNIDSPLRIRKGKLNYHTSSDWDAQLFS